MDLSELPGLLPGSQARGRLVGRIDCIGYNSKTTKSGELFFCLRGRIHDGHLFAPEAVARGACALVVEEFLHLPIPQVRVRDARAALNVVGRRFYGDPAGRLGLVGVTGTNGKTTTAFMVQAMLQQFGRPVGLLGTVFNQVGGQPEPSSLTTPAPADLWHLLGRAIDDGCDWVVMEVSSHALALHRVEPADIDVAVVTNVTRDHFEFHGSFEAYWEAKVRLVEGQGRAPKPGRPRAAVLNADDPRVMAMAERTSLPVLTFGFGGSARVRATDLLESPYGSRFTLHLPETSPLELSLALPGRFNIANALAAAAVAHLAGLDPEGIREGLRRMPPIPGRMEEIDEGQGFRVLVDFAHNPDALANVLSIQPAATGGRKILLFGAEGGKDPGKRPQMGAAARRADIVIISSDNVPREEPEEVAAQIAAGLGDHACEIILDRREAIARTLELALPGDLVIVAGKGHEQTWVYRGERRDFDDRAVVRELLRQRLSQGGAPAAREPGSSGEWRL